MKKLILLAVVVLGFTATSFAQKTANAAANGWIEPPAAALPTTVKWVNDMDFGIITNNSVANTPADAGAGLLVIKGNGNVTPTNLTYTGSPRPAKFLVTGGDGRLPVLTDITLGGDNDHSISNGHVWFDASLDNGYTVITTNGTGQYLISVGGSLRLDKSATGSVNVTGLTVTVNNH